MTRISAMSGLGLQAVPMNEYRDRSRGMGIRGYIPYTSMTKGEFNLALLREQAKLYAAVYPDFPQYAEAVNMLDAALQGGVSRGVNFVRAIPNELQSVARAIVNASKQTRPAAGSFYGRESLVNGIGADPIVTSTFTGLDCEEYATKQMNKLRGGYNNDPTKYYNGFEGRTFRAKNYNKWLEFKSNCEYRKTVEQILNAKLESSSQHMLYKSMPANFEPALGKLPQTKRLFHIAGISDLSFVAGIDAAQMDNWVEIGIQRSNTATPGINKPYSSLVNTGMLTTDPEKWMNYFLDLKDKKIKNALPGGGTVINPKDSKIGIVPAVLAAIAGLVTAIGGALKNAADMQRSMNEKNIVLTRNAAGFGSPGFGPDQADWLQGKNDTTLPIPKDGNNNLLLLGAAAAGIYFLSK